LLYLAVAATIKRRGTIAGEIFGATFALMRLAWGLRRATLEFVSCRRLAQSQLAFDALVPRTRVIGCFNCRDSRFFEKQVVVDLEVFGKQTAVTLLRAGNGPISKGNQT